VATYGQKIIWNTLNGRQSVSIEGCATWEEARSEALQMAKGSGWKPPRWWQWWRWGDVNYEAAE
jgi:hypothetical protein